MPINAKSEFFVAEKGYKDAKSVEEKIKALGEMLRTAPSHKGAEVLRAEIRQKLSKYRSLLEKAKAQKGKGAKISIKKEGAAQIMIVGVPNCGKSSLLTVLTNAKPEIANYEFTTVKPEKGVMEYEGIKIQLVEMPAIIKGYSYSGDGPLLFSIIRNADLIISLLDNTKNIEEQKKIILQEFENANIKLNKIRPNVVIKKQKGGGIIITGVENILGKEEDAKKILQQNGIYNATIDIYEKIGLDDLSELVNESVVYRKTIFVINKVGADEKNKSNGVIPINTANGQGLDKLKKKIWEGLNLIKIFTKSPKKERDWPPIAVKKGSYVEDLAKQVHKDFVERFRFAKIWRKGSNFKNGKVVGLNYKLEDGDIIELHLK